MYSEAQGYCNLLQALIQKTRNIPCGEAEWVAVYTLPCLFTMWARAAAIINPRCMREGYGSLFVCVCVCVCLLPC